MDETLFRIFALIVIATAVSISIYYRRKADKADGEKVSLKEEGLIIVLVLRISGLLLWMIILAYLITPGWVKWSWIDLPDWLRWTGLGMGVLADGLAYWVFNSLGNNVSPTVITRQNHQLVTSGPYRWVRHPLYVMGAILFLGFALLAENWLITLLSIVSLFVLNIRLRKEEGNLIARFGSEYEEYMCRTGKFIPRFNL